MMITNPTPWQVLRLRKKMGWSQQDMANRLHFKSSSMISRYECGTRKMNAAFWELICIKAHDERCKVKAKRDEIEKRINSRVFITQLLGDKRKDFDL